MPGQAAPRGPHLRRPDGGDTGSPRQRVGAATTAPGGGRHGGGRAGPPSAAGGGPTWRRATTVCGRKKKGGSEHSSFWSWGCLAPVRQTPTHATPHRPPRRPFVGCVGWEVTPGGSRHPPSSGNVRPSGGCFEAVGREKRPTVGAAAHAAVPQEGRGGEGGEPTPPSPRPIKTAFGLFAGRPPSTPPPPPSPPQPLSATASAAAGGMHRPPPVAVAAAPTAILCAVHVRVGARSVRSAGVSRRGVHPLWRRHQTLRA